MSLEGKVAIVTGGASGIGRASAVKLAAQGAKLVVSDLNEDGGQETVAMIQSAGGEATYIPCNVTQSAEVQALVQGTIDTYGGFDIAVNNAGIANIQNRIHEIDEDQWDRVINVNLKGVWLCMKYEIPHLITRGGGSIVNMASLSGLVGTAYGADYCASKHGVIGLTKSAAVEYVRQGIRVNAVCPGFIDTPMVEGVIDRNPAMDSLTKKWSPMKRRGVPDEVADAVVYLAGDTSSFVNGIVLPVDAGAFAQ